MQLVRDEATIRPCRDSGRPLPSHDETELIKAAERREIRGGEGSVAHVEVFLMAGVGTGISERPRHLTRDRRAHPIYTLICEEPDYACAAPTNPTS